MKWVFYEMKGTMKGMNGGRDDLSVANIKWAMDRGVGDELTSCR